MRSRAKTAPRDFDSLSNLEVEPFSGTLTPRRACSPSTPHRPAWHHFVRETALVNSNICVASLILEIQSPRHCARAQCRNSFIYTRWEFRSPRLPQDLEWQNLRQSQLGNLDCLSSSLVALPYSF